MPVPASGDYAWKGILPLDDMPANSIRSAAGSRAPTRCRFRPPWAVADAASASSGSRPTAIGVLSNVCRSSCRIRRLQLALRGDVFGRGATLCVHCSANSPRSANDALALMLGWNGNIDAGSQAAALYEFWLLELQKEIRPLIRSELRPPCCLSSMG